MGDYVGLRNSDDWCTFLALAAQLGAKNREDEIQGALEALSENDRKAFFINLYNVITFHGVIQYGRAPGSWYLYVFYITPICSYRVGRMRLSLDHIEHGILRAQHGYFHEGAQAPCLPMPMPRADPRIHMALNCGAKSCPSVAVYSGTDLDAELNDAVEAFVSENSNVKLELIPTGSMGLALAPRMSCSEIFQMYLVDFVGRPIPTKKQFIAVVLLKWMMPFMHSEKRTLAGQCLDLFQQDAPGATFAWLPYNWDTNGEMPEVDWQVYKPSLIHRIQLCAGRA